MSVQIPGDNSIYVIIYEYQSAVSSVFGMFVIERMCDTLYWFVNYIGIYKEKTAIDLGSVSGNG